MRGRLPSGPELVLRMHGSEQARRRLRSILELIAGRRRVRHACQELGLSPTRLEQRRQAALAAALAALEPKPDGRPRRRPDERDEQIAQLEQHVRELEKELALSRAREEIASIQGGAPGPKKRGTKGGQKETKGDRPRRYFRPFFWLVLAYLHNWDSEVPRGRPRAPVSSAQATIPQVSPGASGIGPDFRVGQRPSRWR
jgi:hypothetical protein